MMIPPGRRWGGRVVEQFDPHLPQRSVQSQVAKAIYQGGNRIPSWNKPSTHSLHPYPSFYLHQNPPPLDEDDRLTLLETSKQRAITLNLSTLFCCAISPQARGKIANSPQLLFLFHPSSIPRYPQSPQINLEGPLLLKSIMAHFPRLKSFSVENTSSRRENREEKKTLMGQRKENSVEMNI